MGSGSRHKNDSKREIWSLSSTSVGVARGWGCNGSGGDGGGGGGG